MIPKMEMRTPKPPKPPEKPLMPYMRYSKKVWEQVKNSNPNMKLWEVGKIIGQMWRELPDDEKTLYMEEYDTEKSQYTEALRQYHASPAYQAWLLAKERAEKMMEEHDLERKQAMARVRERSVDLGHPDLRESYILEDNEEDNEDQFTAKHVAAARFQRNHRLMQEILSDSRLPDPGQLITQSRLNTLRSQVEQLKNHKRNLCQEIECCEARHRSRLKRIQEDSEKFVSEHGKLIAARPLITESQFADMIVKAKGDLKHEEEERMSRYLAEVEMRRRKQRQQREAELAAEGERRREQQMHHRQQQQQLEQARSQQSPMVIQQLADSVSQPEKDDSMNQTAAQSPNSSATALQISKPGSSAIDGTPSTGLSPYPATMPQHMPMTGARFPQPGQHTQHHYPPPPNYPPNAASPSPGQGLPSRGQSSFLQQPMINQNLNKTVNPLQGRKTTSSGPTAPPLSSNSSSSKRKKSDVDYSEGAVDRKVNGTVHADRRAVSEESGSAQSRFTEFMNASGAPNDYLQPSGVQSPGPRNPTPQQYPQGSHQPMAGPPVPGSVPPTAAASQPPFGYDHNTPQGSVPMGGSGYYHTAAVQQPTGQHPSGFPPQGRTQFGHGGYAAAGQYPPVPHQTPSGEHPPPPPMYVQHIPQQSPSPHMSQQGQILMNSAPHGPGHPVHPHQAAAMGWHPAGYPPQYGPPRYMGAGGPMGYAVHPVRHVSTVASAGSGSGGYALHQYSGLHHPPQHSHQQSPVAPSVAAPDGNTAGQQLIPAPPPYQQQQQNVPPSYWPAPHVNVSEYTSSGQLSSYAPSPQTETSGSHAPHAENPAAAGHGHSEATSHVATQQQQHGAMYYSGYTHPSMQAPYGPSTGVPAGGGFYATIPPQHQVGSGGSGGQYPQHSWGGYPHPHTAVQQQQQGYSPHSHMHPPPQQQQHQHQLQSSMPPSTGPIGTQLSSKLESSGATSGPMDSSVGNGTSSRPPSVSSQGQQ